MEIVDTATGKIIGAKKGTKGWYHELGHLKFQRTSIGVKVRFYQESFLILTILFLVITQFTDLVKSLLIIIFGAFIYFYLYEEVWCDRYAKKQIKRREKKCR